MERKIMEEKFKVGDIVEWNPHQGAENLRILRDRLYSGKMQVVKIEPSGWRDIIYLGDLNGEVPRVEGGFITALAHNISIDRFLTAAREAVNE